MRRSDSGWRGVANVSRTTQQALNTPRPSRAGARANGLAHPELPRAARPRGRTGAIDPRAEGTSFNQPDTVMGVVVDGAVSVPRRDDRSKAHPAPSCSVLRVGTR